MKYKYGKRAYNTFKRNIISGKKKVFLIENIIKKYILIKNTRHIIYRVYIFYIKNKVIKNGWYIRKIININFFFIRSIFKLHFLKIEFKVRYYKREYIIKIFFLKKPLR